jgi:hypothetical protein
MLGPGAIQKEESLDELSKWPARKAQTQISSLSVIGNKLGKDREVKIGKRRTQTVTLLSYSKQGLLLNEAYHIIINLIGQIRKKGDGKIEN